MPYITVPGIATSAPAAKPRLTEIRDMHHPHRPPETSAIVIGIPM